MSKGQTASTTAIALPLWQMMLVLVGLPAIYMANSLLPWSIGLFQRHEHAFFSPFWTSIAVLHWGSVALVVVLLKRAGGRLADIGLDLSFPRVTAMVAVPLVVGLALIVLREASGANHRLPAERSAVLPATLGEGLFWIFISLTAAFCEELIYRGFGIRMLQGRNVRTWLAVGVATLAFFSMHGVWALALSPFLTIYIAGLLFSALFLWRRSVVPGVCLHALIDVANISVS
jgi:membrane protease YdiL (CAAX protease family)